MNITKNDTLTIKYSDKLKVSLVEKKKIKNELMLYLKLYFLVILHTLEMFPVINNFYIICY